MTVLATQVPFIENQGKSKRPISIEVFYRQYANREDGYCYEWNRIMVLQRKLNDKADDIQLKLDQYFTDGVKTVWQIYPNQKTVHVYTSPYDVLICHGTMLCSASPALADFNIVTQELF